MWKRLLIRRLTDSQVRVLAEEPNLMIPRATFWVYVLMNPQEEIYIGQTSQLAVRLAQHNDPEYRGTLYTKRHPGPWRLVHQEPFQTRAEAMRRERELKSSRGREWIRQHLEGGC